MTLRAWITTTWGRVRETLCPELAVLRAENRRLAAMADRLWLEKQRALEAAVTARVEAIETRKAP